MNGSFVSNKKENTVEIAKKFATGLCGGELILLEGDLSAGKTAFCEGIFEGLDCTGYCTSPTFSIVNVYDGRLKFAHFDLYRLKSSELEQTGIFELLDGGAVVAVEWPSNAPELYLAPHISVELIPDEGGRIINIKR